MHAYQDPNHPGNSTAYHTGKPCHTKCGRPAGTRWSPLLCFPCNVKRMDRISDSMDRIAENLERVAQGPR
jgi:hypothetical protein